jgi:hypothetical protein
VISLPDPLSLPHRVGIVLRWPLGIAHAAWRYGTRSVPVHRVEVDGDRSDLPWPLDAGDGPVQGADEGTGPLLHRTYAVTVDGAHVSPAALMTAFARRPNRAAPAGVARFVKTRGGADVVATGDEFSIRMPGPWNGPVRVVRLSPTSMRLATLEGHLEAGQIEFRAREEGGALVLEIESRARPGDLLSHVLYNLVGVAKEVQLNLWVETLVQLAGRSGGRLRDGVHVTTRRVPAGLVTGPRPDRAADGPAG